SRNARYSVCTRGLRQCSLWRFASNFTFISVAIREVSRCSSPTSLMRSPSAAESSRRASFTGGLLSVEGLDGWDGCAFEVGAEPPVQSDLSGVPGGAPCGSGPGGVPGGGHGGGHGGGLSGGPGGGPGGPGGSRGGVPGGVPGGSRGGVPGGVP